MGILLIIWKFRTMKDPIISTCFAKLQVILICKLRTLMMVRKFQMMMDTTIPIHFWKLQLIPICKIIFLQKMQENSNVHMIVIF